MKNDLDDVQPLHFCDKSVGVFVQEYRTEENQRSYEAKDRGGYRIVDKLRKTCGNDRCHQYDDKEPPLICTYRNS